MSSQWDFYFSNVNNSLASIFVDLGLQEIAPSADNPWLLWVWVQFNHPREDGLSSAESTIRTRCIPSVSASSELTKWIGIRSIW